MIASVSGRVASVGESFAVIEAGGIGYLVHVPSPVAAALAPGAEARLLTNLVVREDSMTLYGFESAPARDMFLLLMSVGGVGPKLALSILSSLDTEGIRRAVAGSDTGALCLVPGVGKRVAERILVDLRDKLGAGDLGPGSGELAAARDALVSLGYTAAELRPVLERLGTSPAPAEELVRSALRELAGAGAPAGSANGSAAQAGAGKGA